MKHTLLLFLLATTLCFGAANAQTASKAPASGTATETTTTVKWDNQDMNLGVIKHQVPQNVEFTFTNTGKAPLIIADVKTSCGCTVAEFPKEPIMPGKKGTIKAIYNAGSIGPFHKSLTVTANIPQSRIDLNISGEVK